MEKQSHGKFRIQCLFLKEREEKNETKKKKTSRGLNWAWLTTRAPLGTGHTALHPTTAHTCFPVPASRGEHLSDWVKKLSAAGPPAPARFWWALLLFWRGLTWAGWRARGGYDCGVGVGVEVNHRALCNNRAYVCVFRFMYVSTQLCVWQWQWMWVGVHVGVCACECMVHLRKTLLHPNNKKTRIISLAVNPNTTKIQ